MTDPRLDPERLLSFLEGTLSPAEAREVEAWLAAHPEAAREVAEHGSVWRALGAYADEPVPPGFAARAVAAALSSERRESAPRASFAWLRGGRAASRAAVAASVLVAVGVGMVLGRGTAPAPAGVPAAVLESIPADVLSEADVDSLASLSDEDFEMVLAGNPDDLAADDLESQGG